MDELRQAIHVCTGQRAAREALDAWLAQHGWTVEAYDDVYAACVQILTNHECVPDLALVGTDWLDDDELAILTYLRQTWPRIGLVVYGEQSSTRLADVLPLTMSCHGPAALDRLLSVSPETLLERLYRRLAVPSVASESNCAAGPPPPAPVMEAERPRPRISAESAGAPLTLDERSVLRERHAGA